jgi:hypothetical protein
MEKLLRGALRYYISDISENLLKTALPELARPPDVLPQNREVLVKF